MIVPWVIGLIALQRIVELLYAQRNTRLLLARGGSEIAAWQHPLFVLFHTAWLASMLAFIPWAAPVNWWLLGVVGLAQVVRVWSIASLGPYWTTRLITVPDTPLVRTGPYAVFPHPNYAVVVVEIALVPAAFGAWPLAAIATLVNIGLLTARLRVENQALARRNGAK